MFEHPRVSLTESVSKDAESRKEDKLFSSLYQRTEIKVADCGFSFRGIAHNKENFLFNEKTIEQEIATSPFVFLEYFNAYIQARATSVSPKKDTSQTKELVGGEYFFSRVAEIAGKNRKDLIVVNPQLPDDPWYQLWASPVAPLVTAVIAGRTTAMSRRSLLHGLSSIPFIATTTDFGTATFEVNRNKKLTQDKQRFQLWNRLNWRDVNSAIGTRVAMKAFNEKWSGKSAIAFYGAFHQGMLKYIENPTAAEKRRWLYPQYALSGVYSIRRYHFDESKWSLTAEIPY